MRHVNTKMMMMMLCMFCGLIYNFCNEAPPTILKHIIEDEFRFEMIKIPFLLL